MGGMSVFALQLGRRQQGINALLNVVEMMAVADPKVLWDVGFQLSFNATLGLVLSTQPSQEWFVSWAGCILPEKKVHGLTGLVRECFLFTMAARSLPCRGL